MAIIEEISAALQKGKKKEVIRLVQQAIEEGIDAQVILQDGLLPGRTAGHVSVRLKGICMISAKTWYV